jgi:hypothetical protein
VGSIHGPADQLVYQKTRRESGVQRIHRPVPSRELRRAYPSQSTCCSALRGLRRRHCRGVFQKVIMGLHDVAGVGAWRLFPFKTLAQEDGAGSGLSDAELKNRLLDIDFAVFKTLDEIEMESDRNGELNKADSLRVLTGREGSHGDQVVQGPMEKWVLHRFEYTPWGVRNRARSRADRIGWAVAHLSLRSSIRSSRMPRARLRTALIVVLIDSTTPKRTW